MKTFTQSDMILHDGEVLVISTHILSAPPEVKKNGLVTLKGDTYFNSNGNMRVVYYSTMANIEGVKQLDRQKFVKPVDDVKKLANDQSKLFYHEPSEIKSHFKVGFKAGYNANKAEFTKMDMEIAWNAGILSHTEAGFKDFESFLKHRISLSLPKQITIQNDEIINVEW